MVRRHRRRERVSSSGWVDRRATSWRRSRVAALGVVGRGRPPAHRAPVVARRAPVAFARSFAVVNLAFATGWLNVIRGREIEVWHRAELRAEG